MITTAAVLRGAAGDVQGHIDEHLGIEEITLEEPRSDEVLVRIVASGICHSDLAAINGDLPISRPVILGHEGSGIVERVGSDVASVRPGDPVVLSFASCGACRACRTGHPVYCARSAAMNLSGTRADGSTAYRGADRRAETIFGHFVGQSSFAHHALVHESAVVKVGADVELAVAAPLGCGIQTGAGSVMNVLRPAYGSSLAVTGTGSVGLSAVMAAKVVGCEVIIAVDVNDARLELAGRLGATHTLNPTGHRRPGRRLLPGHHRSAVRDPRRLLRPGPDGRVGSGRGVAGRDQDRPRPVGHPGRPIGAGKHGR